MSAAGKLRIKLQVMCGEEIAMGPGKADLLDAIMTAGSISAAARRIGMSYRRAWMLVDVMNRCWREDVVETGGGGRGAQVTAYGRIVLAHYRKLQQAASGAARRAGEAMLEEGLRDAPRDPR